MRNDELPVKSRTAMDKDYLALVGETVFLYNMFEETLAAILEECSPGFWSDYFSRFRFNPNHVHKYFCHATSLEQDEKRKMEMLKIADAFLQAMDIRSAVAHGRPSTDPKDGNRQVLNYQTGSENPPKPGEEHKPAKKQAKKDIVLNRYKDTQLTYPVLHDACEELERGCSMARSFYSSIRTR